MDKHCLARRRLMVGAGQALIVSAAAKLPAAYAADHYPSRPVRVVAPFPPGQGTDIIARLLTQELSTRMRQSFYVENKPGAGGVIGTHFVKDAKPDGYTLLVSGAGPLAINVSLYSNLPYDPVKDLQPAAMIAAVPNILVVRADFPAKTLADLVTYVKQRPGKLSFASSGNGVPGHLIMQMFETTAGLSMQHVPYQGTGAATTSVLAGDTAMMFDTASSLIGQVQSGALRALATASPKRARALPNVPTIMESGFPTFQAQGWSALLAPAGTPASVIEQLAQASKQIVADPAIQKKLITLDVDPLWMSPEATRAYMIQQVAYWARAVKLAGAKLG